MLFDGFSQRNHHDIFNEIKELYALGARDFAFYDDALLIHADSHIKEILQEVIQSDIRVRFHSPNGMHARFIDDELACLMKKSGFTTLRLGLETVNGERQLLSGGKVTNDDFAASVKRLKRHRFTKKEIGVCLMYGLPGQELKEVRENIMF